MKEFYCIKNINNVYEIFLYYAYYKCIIYIFPKNGIENFY